MTDIDTFSRVIRVPDLNVEDSYVLVHLQSAGTKQLDLTLVATEGEAPYKFSLRQSHISSLRSRTSQVTELEWEAILKCVLLGESCGEDDHSDLQILASVAENSSITITIRRSTEGIVTRLGTITLTYDGDEEISLFDWLGTSCLRATTLESRVREAQKEVQVKADLATALQKQIDDFIKSKREEEQEMLEKFCILLNNKKAKIRELMARNASEGDQTRKVGISSKGKRKADDQHEITDDEDPDTMDVDHDRTANDDQEVGTETSDEDADGDDTVDEDEEPAAKTNQALKGSDDMLIKESIAEVENRDQQPSSDPDTPPPLRALPFPRKETKDDRHGLMINRPSEHAALSAPTDDGEETASEDEL